MKHSALTCVVQHLDFTVCLKSHSQAREVITLFWMYLSCLYPSCATRLSSFQFYFFNMLVEIENWVQFCSWVFGGVFCFCFSSYKFFVPHLVTFSWVSPQWPPLVIEGYCPIFGLKILMGCWLSYGGNPCTLVAYAAACSISVLVTGSVWKIINSGWNILVPMISTERLRNDWGWVDMDALVVRAVAVWPSCR